MKRQVAGVVLKAGSVECAGRANDIVIEFGFLEIALTDDFLMWNYLSRNHRLMPGLPKIQGFGRKETRKIVVIESGRRKKRPRRPGFLVTENHGVITAEHRGDAAQRRSPLARVERGLRDEFNAAEDFRI